MRSRLNEIFQRWLGRYKKTPKLDGGPARMLRNHVISIDGTMCALSPTGYETNAGLSYNLVCETGAAWVHYEPGIQWRDWT